MRLRAPLADRVVFFCLILAALGGVIVPGVLASRAGADRKRCIANVKQIVLGMIQYADKNNDRFPNRGAGSRVQTNDEYMMLLCRSLRADPSVLLCPSASDEDLEDGRISSYIWSRGGRTGAAPPPFRLESGRLPKYGSEAPLCADRRAVHRGGVRIVGFADGSARELDAKEFAKYQDHFEE